MAHLSGSASTEIDAPVEQVWEVVEDVLAAPRWQGGLVAMSALERDADGRPTWSRSSTTSRSGMSRRECASATSLSPTFPGRRRRVISSQSRAPGRLEELGEGRTRATYTLDSDPGRVLGMLLRGPAEAAILAMLVNARPGELKLRVENA